LTWAERKAELLSELGVDATIAYPTDEAFLELTPRQFFDRIIVEHFQAKAIVEGPNFHFGCRRDGDVRLLQNYCEKQSIALEVVQAVISGDYYVSSSRVRDCVRRGDIDSAREMLTRPYRVRGLVTHGARRGGGLGFPTANVEAVDTLLPGPGVYAGSAIEAQRRWPAAINIGPNPTFREHSLKFEVHLIGYEGSLYGEPLEVDFLSRLRDIRPFPSVDDLKRQLHRDVAASREVAEQFAYR
jgi:riboflavin kinase/FMN adenylyltransferase